MRRFVVALLALLAVPAVQAQVSSWEAERYAREMREMARRLYAVQREDALRQAALIREHALRQTAFSREQALRQAELARQDLMKSQVWMRRDHSLLSDHVRREAARVSDLAAHQALLARTETRHSVTVQRDAMLAQQEALRSVQLAQHEALRHAANAQSDAQRRGSKDTRAYWWGWSDMAYSLPDSCADIEVKLAALNALKQMDSAKVVPVLKKLFARRDECSLPLRRRAMQYGLIPREVEGEVEDLVVSIATTDPDVEVRRSAIQMLQNDSSEKAVQGLYKALTAFEDQQTQQAALGALASNPMPSSRRMIKTFIESASTPEDLKATALQQLTSSYSYYHYSAYRGQGELIYYDRNGQPRVKNPKQDSVEREARMKETGTYLREVFPKLPSETLKRQVISAISQNGGVDNAKWLLTVAQDTKEPIDIRRSALSSVGRIPLVRPSGNDSRAYTAYGMPSGALAVGIDELVKAYDKFEDRQMKRELLQIFAHRTEDASFNKLASIAKDDKDNQMRQEAIRYLSASKDPRAAKALSDVLDK
jgi:hypothetical protein